MKSLIIWYRYTVNSFQIVLSNRLLAGVFLLGKILRIALFVVFLWYLFEGAESLAGYSKEQIIFFYLSFNFIETLAQFLFREVYRFRSLIVSGDFDLVLLKPINPLLRVLLGGADFMDLTMVGILLFTTLWYGANYISFNLANWLLYGWMIFIGLLISAAFHILVLALGVVTTSVDHLIMVYRDLSSLMRIPVNAYLEPLRSILIFGLMLGMIYAFPPDALIGNLSWKLVFISSFTAGAVLWLANRIWKWSLRSYSSASS